MAIRRATAIVALSIAGIYGVYTAAVSASPAGTGRQPIDLRVDGGEENWHPERLFALRWSNPPGPIAVVHYRVLRPSGEIAIGETTMPWPATSIQHVSVPGEAGAYKAEVWLEDGDGAEGAPAIARLRFDDRRPGPVQALPSDGWIGRAQFPYPVRLSHPSGPAPPSGIRGYAVSVDGSPEGSPCAESGPCTEDEVDLHGGIEADSLLVGELPEGVNYVHAVAVSGAGMPSATPASTVLRVDKTDPLLHLSGDTGGWSSRPLDLEVTATDSASGMVGTAGTGGPFTAIRIDGGAPKIAAGDAVSTTVIASGVHTVSYYARDAAGNVADGDTSNGVPNHQPATAVVKVDREPPLLTFTGRRDPLDPERIEAVASDGHSGIDPARGSIAVRRVGSNESFAPLPTELAGDLLRARWDSAAYPAGEYEFRAKAYDRAGNLTSTLNRRDGTPLRLQGPLKVAARLQVDARERAVRFGRGVWFGGHLIAARRTPVAGARVMVVERFGPGAAAAERVSTVMTNAAGAFGLRLPAGASRQVTASVMPTTTLRGASSQPLRITVRSHVSLRTSAPTARVGGTPVVFSGRVANKGAVVPDEGKSVQLQFRLPGLPWSEFRTVRTDARGRFRLAYRFADDDSRGVKFQFRAFAPAQTGWPYEPAGSLPVAVQGI